MPGSRQDRLESMKASVLEAGWVEGMRAMLHAGPAVHYRMLSRLLLLSTSFLLLLMPWMEHLWSFDRFCHGGQDLEFGLLVSVSVLCLALLLLEHGRDAFFRLFRVLTSSSGAARPSAPPLLQYRSRREGGIFQCIPAAALLPLRI